MSPPAERTSKVWLRAPGDGAYKIQVLGDDPRTVINDVLVGPNSRRQLDLPPGVYTALFETIGSSAKGVQTIEVRAKGPLKTRVLMSTLVNRPPTMVRAPPAGAEDGVAPGSVRQFSVGISTDTRPDVPGGYVPPDDLDVTSSRDPDTGALQLDITRPTDWDKAPKRRLTISIDGLPAWRVQLPLFQPGLVVRLTPTRARQDGGADFHVTVLPREGSTVALAGALDGLSAVETKRIFRWSVGDAVPDIVNALLDKSLDPWAASIAGLVLARDPEWQFSEEPAWAGRLMCENPWLPDGAIVAAAATVKRKGESRAIEARCVELLSLASRRGPPVFRFANELALNLLTRLAVGAETAQTRRAAQAVRSAWTAHVRHLVDTGLVMGWEVSGKGLRRGRLPNKTYRVVATGVVTADDYTLAADRA